MNKRTKDKQARDKCIVRLFYDRLRLGDSRMAAYAYCAEWYDLSEDQVQRILRDSRNNAE